MTIQYNHTVDYNAAQYSEWQQGRGYVNKFHPADLTTTEQQNSQHIQSTQKRKRRQKEKRKKARK